jgi:ribose transport system substrate-binding protein
MTHESSRRDFLRTASTLGVGAVGLSMMQTVTAAAQDGRRLKCAMSSAGLGGSWNVQGKAAAEHMATILEIEVVWFDGEWSVQKQRDKMDQVATSKDWDFVAVQPSSIGVLKDPFTRIAANGIPVIDMDTLAAPLDEMWDIGILTLVAPDHVALAESVVTKIIERMGGKGNIARSGGVSGHSGSQGRHQGFKNVVKRFPNVEIVDDQPADWSGERAAQLWETILNRHPDITGGFFDNDDMALAARRVIVGVGKGDQVAIGGVDMMPSAIEAVRVGDMVATSRNSPSRIHAWSVLAGAFAATVGLEEARERLPRFILSDGPTLTADIDANPEAGDKAWLLRNLGLTSFDGQLWLEEQFVL